MEDQNKPGDELELEPETPQTPEEEPAQPEPEEPAMEPEKTEDIDFNKELENLEGQKPQKTELERAKNALFFNAKRYAELGGDPTEVLPKPKAKETTVTPEGSSEFMTKEDFAEGEARKLAKTEAELKVIMWHYKHGIQRSGSITADIENAYILANKGRLIRSVSEARRADAPKTPGGGPGRKAPAKIPERSPEEQQVLQRRGLSFDAKTQTWKGKFTEEFYDPTTGTWQSRKLT